MIPLEGKGRGPHSSLFKECGSCSSGLLVKAGRLRSRVIKELKNEKRLPFQPYVNRHEDIRNRMMRPLLQERQKECDAASPKEKSTRGRRHKRHWPEKKIEIK